MTFFSNSKSYRVLYHYEDSRIVKYGSYVHVCVGMLTNSMEIVNPFVLGCDTKNTKVVPMCLSALQKLIQFETVSLVCYWSKLLVTILVIVGKCACVILGERKFHVYC